MEGLKNFQMPPFAQVRTLDRSFSQNLQPIPRNVSGSHSLYRGRTRHFSNAPDIFPNMTWSGISLKPTAYLSTYNIERELGIFQPILKGFEYSKSHTVHIPSHFLHFLSYSFIIFSLYFISIWARMEVERGGYFEGEGSQISYLP